MSLPTSSLAGPVVAGLPVPLFLAGCTVPAGFPSPADDVGAQRIDLNDILISHPAATFLFRVRGPSMVEAGIHDDDLVLVNRALKPKHGNVVLAAVDNEFTVKYLHLRAGQFRLKAANATYPDIVPKDGQVVTVWGVVTSGITIFVKTVR